jgi:hypothetical protein
LRGRLVALAAALVVNACGDANFPISEVQLPASTLLPSLPEIVLSANGVGPVSYGDSAEAVFEQLSDLFGSPVEDADQPCTEGGDPGRFLRWGNLLTMSDGDRFRSFIYGLYFPGDAPPIQARTAEGLTLGMSGTELREIYGDRVDFGEPLAGFESGRARRFSIDGYAFEEADGGLGGYLEGDVDTGTVVTLVGGSLCPSLG